MKRLHEQIKAYTKKVNEAYKIEANKNSRKLSINQVILFGCILRRRFSPLEEKAS